MDNGVIGFNHFTNEQGESRWGCRGVGPQYEEFYRWFNSLDRNLITHQSDDWPWHYFGFTNLAYDSIIYEKYAGNIFED